MFSTQQFVGHYQVVMICCAINFSVAAIVTDVKEMTPL